MSKYAPSDAPSKVTKVMNASFISSLASVSSGDNDEKPKAKTTKKTTKKKAK